MLNTPILFLIFSRPHTTQRVFEQIRNVKPRQLFVAADGPRLNHPTDHNNCQQARQIIEGIDWHCEVKTLYRNDNLGCKRAISEGITWFFSHVDRGIILEDDCLPTIEFFKFCKEGLVKFENDTSIAAIGGFVATKSIHPFLSVHGSIWGWASWKRAWDIYDPNVVLEDEDLKFIANNASIFSVIEKLVLNIKLQKKAKNTWDYYWLFSRIKSKKMTILPGVPLTRNIGFNDSSATHLNGNKPKSLIEAENLKIESESLDLNMLVRDSRRYVKIDYKRIWRRSPKSVFKNLLVAIIKKPVKFLILILIHICRDRNNSY